MSKKMMGWGEIFDLPAWEIFPGTPEQRAFNVMQYTGLKDKNGKEIYEGDILECTSELLTNFGATRTGRYETTYKQVIWLTDSWGYRVLKSKHIIEGAERKGLEVAIKFGVVCGNIHENPELIKTK